MSPVLYSVRVTTILFFLLVVTLARPDPAMAYLDPGTGSYVFQAAMAAALGWLFIGRTYISRIAAALRGKRSRSENEDQEEKEDEPSSERHNE